MRGQPGTKRARLETVGRQAAETRGVKRALKKKRMVPVAPQVFSPCLISLPFRNLVRSFTAR